MTDTSTPAPPHSEQLAAEASEFRMATFRLARRLRAERAVDAMSDAQFAVLANLKVHGPHTLSELADRERVSPPSMNRTVSCLSDHGYLTRAADPDDGRKVILDLSAEGRDVVEETVRRRDAWLEDVLAQLSEGDRAALQAAAQIMRKVAER